MNQLLNLLREEEIGFTVWFDTVKMELKTIGDRASLESADLITSYFGSPERAADLSHSLEGQPLPRLIRQAQVRGLLHRPNDSLVIGLFRNDTRGIGEAVEWSKGVGRKLEVILNI